MYGDHVTIKNAMAMGTHACACVELWNKASVRTNKDCTCNKIIIRDVIIFHEYSTRCVWLCHARCVHLFLKALVLRDISVRLRFCFFRPSKIALSQRPCCPQMSNQPHGLVCGVVEYSLFFAYDSTKMT